MHKGDRLNIDHVNAQSLLANKDEIGILLTERKTDIFCVTETWLTADVPNDYITIPNYVVYRCDKAEVEECVYTLTIFSL